MWHDILSLIWIFLPVGLANTGPVLANNISVLKNFSYPLDFNRSWRGQRILGDHKTIRGLLAGMLVGMAVAGVQMLLANMFHSLENYSFSLIDYASYKTLLIGLVFGFGALAGDAVKSFFKRQIGIAPGKNWVPYDQLDFVIGGALASTLFFVLPARLYLLGFVLALILHPTFNVIAWLLHLQDEPF